MNKFTDTDMKPRFYKKTLILFILILVLLPSIIALQPYQNDTLEFKQKTQTRTVYHNNMEISRINDHVSINLENSNSYTTEEGHPKLPMITQVFTFPLETRIKTISCIFSSIEEKIISTYVEPVPQAIPKVKNQLFLDSLFLTSTKIDLEIYQTNQWYPSIKYTSSTHIGLINGSRMLQVILHMYPIQYNPVTGIIHHAKETSITIEYEEPHNEINTKDNVDMVIITPRKFVSAVVPLMIHKNAQGISTKIKTVESIYRDAFLGKYLDFGRDPAEKIKYFIHYAVEQWDITYILFVGGHTHQSQRWEVPVRYSNLHDRSFWNDTYVTDLYFADIYRYNMSTSSLEFEDWDSNNNDIIGEWTWIFDPERGWWYDLDKKDDLDLYPDVAVGRLACRTLSEVQSVVDKIIHYERRTYSKEWFNRIICAGGDTVPFTDGVCEGEIETNLGASFLEPLGFSSTKLWVSDDTLTPNAVVRELRKGAGFLYLSGHGTPLEWCTHPQTDGDTWIDVYTFQLKPAGNFYKLPICVVGGCHNSQFDVCTTNFLKGILSYGLQYFFWDDGIECFQKGTWVPSCWSWELVAQKRDGFIAAIGNTGLGWGVGGENCVEYNEGYLTTRFFETYATKQQQGIQQLGLIHCETINQFISHFSANDDLLDRKTVEEWVLLGDPSLMIGGYQ